MNQTNQTAVTPIETAYQKRLDELKFLRSELIRLTALRDDLTYRICPALQAIYEKEIGSLEREILAAEIYLQEKKRILELLKAQTNRRETMSYRQAEETAKKETQDYQDDLNRRAEEAEAFKKSWEKSAWSSFRENHDGGEDDGREENRYDGDEPSGASSKKSNPATDIKKLYRQLIKRLHPDGRPNVTEREKELFHMAQQAYERGDFKALERIRDELDGMDVQEASFQETPDGLAEMDAFIARLYQLVEGLKKEVAEIRSTFPYTMKDLLEDDEMLVVRHGELLEKLEALRSANETLDSFIDQVKAEMNYE